MQASSPFRPPFTKKALISVLIVGVLLLALASPIIPTQYKILRTRNRDLRYDSQVIKGYAPPYGSYSRIVNVTNTDSIGGNFSITMETVYTTIDEPDAYIAATSNQSAFISAGSTYSFYLPSDWVVFDNPPATQAAYYFTYSINATIIEAYNLTKTEYRSILALTFH